MTGDPDGSLRLSDTITRAEAAKIICISGNLQPADTDSAYFPDVAESHWAHGYISALKQNGTIAGDENGYFNPESWVTNEEIVKMIVCLLGYDVMAEPRGGYPAGYTAQAAKLGITEGLQFAVNTPAVRGDVGLMIQRALDVPLLLQNTDNEDVTSYIRADGLNGAPSETLRKRLVP